MYPEVRTNSKFKYALITVSWLPMSCHRVLMTAGLSTGLRFMAQEECLDPFVSIVATAAYQNQSWCSQAIAGLERIATVPPLSRKLVHLTVCFPMTNKINSTFSLQRRWELGEAKMEVEEKSFQWKESGVTAPLLPRDWRLHIYNMLNSIPWTILFYENWKEKRVEVRHRSSQKI